MLRITRIDAPAAITTLRLEGRILGPWVSELQRECERIIDEQRKVVVDLSAVRFADRQGVRLLQSLTETGIPITGASLFMRTLIDRRLGSDHQADEGESR